MTCTDPGAVRAFEREGVADGAAFEEHLAGCEACRGLYSGLRAGLTADVETAHPAAAALVAFEEGSPALEPATRDWLARHLETCEECRTAVAAVAAEPAIPASPSKPAVHTLPAEPVVPVPAKPAVTMAYESAGRSEAPGAPPGTGVWRQRWWPAAAAAGWIVAAILAFRSDGGEENPPGDDAIARTHTLVLSATRGEARNPVPRDAELLRIEFVLGEPVARGAALRFRVERIDGTAVFERDVTIKEVGDWDFPVITLRRRTLPEGRVRMKLRTPSGSWASFEVDLGP